MTNREIEENLVRYVQQLDPKEFGRKTMGSVLLTRLTGGLHNLNYLVAFDDESGQKYVLRVHPSNNSGQDSVSNEARLLKLVKNVSIPAVIHVSKPDFIDSSIMITEYIDGEPIATTALHREEIEELARAVSALHAPVYPTFTVDAAHEPLTGSYKDYLQAKTQHAIHERLREVPAAFFVTCQKVMDEALEKIDSLLKENDEAFHGREFSLLHNDIGTGNLLWSHGKVTIIDWEDITFGDPADEVAYIFAIGNVSEHFQRVFLETYCQNHHDSLLTRRVPVYHLQNKLLDVAWSIEQLYAAVTDKSSLLKRPVEQYQEFYDVRLRSLQKSLGEARASHGSMEL